MFAADGVFGDPAPMREGKHSGQCWLGGRNGSWGKNLLHMKQEDAGLTDESENNPVLLITARDLLQLQRNVKTNQ